MKKNLIFLLIAGLFTFTACSDDDDNGGEELSITATWELTSVNPNIIPGWDPAACPNNPEITFTADGTAIWTLYDSENSCVQSSSSGDWTKKDGNNYTVTIPNFGDVDGTVDFSGANQFTFTTYVETFPVVFTFNK